MPNALIGLLAVGLAVLLRWYLRRAAGRQQPQAGGQHAVTQTPSEAVTPDATSSDPNPHPGSLTRPERSGTWCGTIGAVTPMPAPPISSPGAGAPHGTGVEPRGDVEEVPETTDRILPVLAEAVEIARAAAADEALPGDDPIGSPVLTLDPQAGEAVGAHVGVVSEGEWAATHFFESNYPGYVGWLWSVTVATAGPGEPVTVSEVVLLPGSAALTAPDWVPWNQRLRAGDLGAGDLLPSSPDDPRLVPGYVESDDPAIEEVAHEIGLGRRRVLSREGRLEAAERWYAGEFGPDAEMARMAPGNCGTCGFYLRLAGSLGAAFGVCTNEVTPADGRVVHVEFGCGAHSEAEVDTSSTVPVAEVVYDDATLDYESRTPEGGGAGGTATDGKRPSEERPPEHG